MNKKLSLSIVFITGYVFNNAYTMEKTTNEFGCILHQPTGVFYKKNNFGDIFPQWQHIPCEQLSERLSSFVNQLKNEVKETPFIITVPHEHAATISSIKNAGFTLYHANNDTTEWIFKNNSSIPDPYNALLGAAVFVRKGNDLLVVEEKTRRGFFCTPGGGVDIQELSRAAAIRELKEEVNLDAQQEDLRLFATTNRINTNRFHANNITHYYTVDHSKTSGDLIPNPNEIVRAFYIPLKDIAEQPSVDGLNIPPAIAALAKHLLNKNSHSHHETFLDYRQLLKKDSERNHNDTMTIEFFAQ